MSLLPAGVGPYLGPYAAFLVLVELQRLYPSAAPALFVLRVAVPSVLVAAFWVRGAYPELRGHRLGLATLGDILVGVAIAALWVGPYLLWPSLERGTPFDTALLGAERQRLTLALRLTGFALVTPFVEELFVRSFLLRFAEVVDHGDFREAPIGRFAWRGFVLTAVWFTLTHAQWEWCVALPTGIAFNLWLYRRRHLMACVISHAVANATIWALVVFGPLALWDFL
jgi:CAAX prenyl protease-like protein